MKHILLRNPRLEGVQYGTLRSLEREIVNITNAEIIDVPFYGVSPLIRRAGHGMRLDFLRSAIPARPLKIDADVIWYILMGPENFELDLFKHWNIKAKKRIVYLYDTLEGQFPLVKRLFSSDLFNIRITSFTDAAPILEDITGRSWHAIEQAVPDCLFYLAPPEKRIIDFSSYGRRYEPFHTALKEFCKAESLYYDYSYQDGRFLTASPIEAYRQYAWHIRHSTFTISWPVELTNPSRAGRLNPITCRWFEAATSGTVILGKKPNNPNFDSQLTRNLIVEVDPYADKRVIWKRLSELYARRLELLMNAEQISNENKANWTWSERVARMLNLVSA